MRAYVARNAEERAAYMKAYAKEHQGRRRQRQRARYAADPVKHRDQFRRRKYGVSAEQSRALLAAQGNRCGVCATDTPAGRGHWNLDHDHATGKVRGFLCRRCNVGLGCFQDDPVRLEQAAAYLRRHKKDV